MASAMVTTANGKPLMFPEGIRCFSIISDMLAILTDLMSGKSSCRKYNIHSRQQTVYKLLSNYFMTCMLFYSSCSSALSGKEYGNERVNRKLRAMIFIYNGFVLLLP